MQGSTIRERQRFLFGPCGLLVSYEVSEVSPARGGPIVSHNRFSLHSRALSL